MIKIENQLCQVLQGNKGACNSSVDKFQKECRIVRWAEIHEEVTTMPKDYPELSVVRVMRDVESSEGLIPKGSSGTVVAKYAGGIGYEVEFTRPIHTVATLDVSDLTQ